MKRQIVRDEFFDRQPSLSFVEGLKQPVHTGRPARFDRTTAEAGEIPADGLFLDNRFPDPYGLLETVTADFTRFAALCGITGSRYPIRLQQGETDCFESYIIETDSQSCVVTAADSEGIRRAVLFLEQELIAREGPFLPSGRILRKPWLKSRIIRGFFSPTNRPPKNGDELLDDVDYYPEEYLNRMMHDGTNGIWIYTSFRQLLPSDIIREYGVDYERRVEKLNRVIAKCRRYGIKVYVFAIEPAGLPDDLAEHYRDMVGERTEGMFNWTMCPHSDRTKAFCYEAGHRLFTLCPDLGGFISITAGERTTSCATLPNTTCPRCAGTPRGQLLVENIQNLFAGMHAAKPDAECISWTYEHRNWDDEDIRMYVKDAPHDALLMQNFDDRGYAEQLGRERQAMDYWLSYIGPSELFELTAEAAKQHGKHLWAKMQICCSHELATLPYIPVPGNVFGKLRGAFEWGVEGIMESWYFGNYPCFMSKAVGDLAFCHDFSDEQAYLLRLASMVYGRSAAPQVVRAWQLFQEGYRQYPLNIMFSYYSPAHDGVVWELALKPKNFAPSRSWLLLDKPNGDRICDSVLVGHTHEEALTLLTAMKDAYSRAVDALPSDPGEALDDLRSVSSALLVLCRSACNILQFYKLRDDLGIGAGDPQAVLAAMEALVQAEIQESSAMIALCEADNRLGYHSEAEGFKFFPEKLRHRIRQLEDLLATEFPEVAARIEAGLPPLTYYLGEEEDCTHVYTIRPGSIEQAGWELLSDGKSAFRLTADDRDLIFELRTPEAGDWILQPEFRLFRVFAGITIHMDASGQHAIAPGRWSDHWPFHKPEAKAAELRKWRMEPLPAQADGSLCARIRIAKADTGMRGTAPFRLALDSECGVFWETEPLPTRTLGKTTISPGCFGWVKFAETECAMDTRLLP